MAAKKRHELVLDRFIVKQIDYTLPKLKYSVNFRKIIRWLENFEKEDVDKAIDFLFFLEFIDIPELTFRMNEQLSNALQKIPPDYNVFIYPCVASYPKSTEVINYILKDTPSYKKRKVSYHCEITRDLEKDYIKRKKTAIILVDDFIGSGKTFEKGYDTETNLKQWLDSKKAIKLRFYISAVCMFDGKLYINSRYPEIRIFSECRFKLFDPVKSPFTLRGNVNQMKRLAVKYGHGISPRFDTPLGFDNSESLVAFSHTTPNNTLPIIWGALGWFPIYPRFGGDKIKQAIELKKEVAFYIGIMNRLGIDLYSNESIMINRKRKLRYNSKKDHSLLCVLKLKMDSYESLVICQILGITKFEYNEILNYGKTKKLIDNDGKISSQGITFFKEVMAKTRSRRYIKKDKELFEMKYLNYVPKSFGGVS